MGNGDVAVEATMLYEGVVVPTALYIYWAETWLDRSRKEEVGCFVRWVCLRSMCGWTLEQNKKWSEEESTGG